MMSKDKIGKNPAQTVEEMSTEMIESRDRQLAPQHRGQTVYKAAAGEYNASRLQDLIHCSIEELAQTVEKAPVSLEDTEDVIQRAFAYLRCCEENAVFPSNLGLARALGYSNRALCAWRQKKSDTPTGKFLQSFAETCADILHTSSLNGNANAIISIFLSKAMYDITDNTSITINTGNAYNDPTDTIDVEEIRRRYTQEE